MDEKYMIFNRKVYLRPYSKIDGYGNSKAIELSKVEAVDYVEQLNKKFGKDLFYYLSIAEWQERLEHSRTIFEENDQKNKEIFSQLFEDSGLQKEIEEINQEMDNNINGFSLPISVKSNEEYRVKLKQILSEYSSAVNKPAFKLENDLINDVSLVCDNIIKSFDLMIEGKNNEAEIIIAEILEIFVKHEFGVSELDKSYAFRGTAPFEHLHTDISYENKYKEMMSGNISFYRARTANKNEKNKVEQLKDIVSLPYSLRNNSNDLRFSSRGEICLYLGTTSFVCSQESRWDEKEQNLYMAAFKFNDRGKKLKVLNLAISESLINGVFNKGIDKDEYKKELQCIMIKIFPLIIATSFTVTTSDKNRVEQYKENMKYEYLLSQLLIKAIKKVGIDGVAYLSRQGKNDLQYPHGVNLAIPMNDISEKKEYSDIYKCFEVTKPVLFREEDLNTGVAGKISYINKHYLEFWNDELKIPDIMAKVYYKENYIFYGKTPYAKLDDYLVSQMYYNFPI